MDSKESSSIQAETFRKLMEHGTEGALILDARGLVSYASPSTADILGYGPAELKGTLILELSHPDDLEMLHFTLLKSLQKPGTRIKVPICRILHKDGSYRWIESVVTNMLPDPDVRGITGSFRDVTQDHVAQEKLVYANRLYDFLRHINHAIVHTAQEKALFQEACQIAVENGGFRFAWIGIPDRSSGKVPMVASAGGTARDEEFFRDYTYDDSGPISKILEGSDYFVVDHIQSRKNLKFIAYANDRGFQSAIVLPLRKSGEVFAVMSLYATGRSFFDSTEIALLAEASADLSYAVDVFERDKQRTLALRALQQKELRLSQAQEIANVGSWDHDFATGVSNWSAQALRIYGLDARHDGPTYKQWISCIHPEDRARVSETTKKAEKDFLDCAFYHRILRPDGDIRYVHTQSYFEFDENGAPKGMVGIVHDVTEVQYHKQALRASNDAFRESEFRYRQIVENAHEGIWLLDKYNNTVFVNEKMGHILGYEPDQMLGKAFNAFTFDQETETTPNTRDASTNVIRFRTASGKIIWANVAFGPIMETGRLALVSDMTEKMELEALLYNATTMARIGGYELDLADGTMFWSPMTREIHEVGDSFTPSLATAVAFYKEGNSRDTLIEAGYKALKEGIPWDLELQIITAAGNQRWVRVIGEPEHCDGRCIRIYGSFQDIDSRKRAELEFLNIAEEKNRILESIGDGFFAVDTQWNITYWNKQAEVLLKRKRSDAIGKNLWELYPEVIGTDYFTYYHRAVKENSVQQFEALYEPIQMWTEISAYPSTLGLSIYFKDITQRKQAEAEKSVMMAEIIRRNQNLEQFSYIVSHNLRGPVANIMGIALELMNDNNPPETQKLLKEGLAISARRLDEVIIDLNGILQLQKEVMVSKEPICLHWLVDGIKDSIIDLIRREHVTIRTDFTAIGELVTLKSYLYSIFYNLIINSIKYRHPDRDPIIEITTARQGGKVMISFKDNGLGIDLDTKRDQVFGIYKRFHDHVEGKGLGLFMVKTQVEMIGGTIGITSEAGTGTILSLELDIKAPSFVYD